MLGQLLRRCPNIVPTLGECLVLAGSVSTMVHSGSYTPLNHKASIYIVITFCGIIMVVNGNNINLHFHIISTV